MHDSLSRNDAQGSVANCRGSWVWMWVVGVSKRRGQKKRFPSKITVKKIKKQKVVRIEETKISAYIPVIFPFLAVSKENKRIL